MQTSETVEEAPGSKPRLKREIGLWMAVALVVGNMVGSGIFLTAVNSLGVKQGAQVQLVTTILKFVPLVLIAIVGLFFVNTHNLTPFAPHGAWKAISAAAPLTLWAFIGLEPELFERKLFVRDMLIAAVAFIYSVWAITGSGKDIIGKGFVLLIAGVPVYVLMKGWQRREALKVAFARKPGVGPAVPRPLGPAGLAHKRTGVDQ